MGRASQRLRTMVKCGIQTAQAPVAQLDRVSPSEGEGHRFESCRVRQPSKNISESIGADRWETRSRKKWETLVQHLDLADGVRLASSSGVAASASFRRSTERVALGLLHREPTEHRHQFVHCCAVFGCNGGTSFTQAMCRAMRHACLITPITEPVTEAGCSEWSAGLGCHQERQVAGRAGVNDLLEWWQNRNFGRDGITVAVLVLGELQPSIANVLPP
jgi:hypothetical protein